MQKRTIFFSIIIAVIIVSSFAVYALGSGEGTSSSNASSSTSTTTPPPSTTTQRVNCETKANVEARIKCRFAHRGNVVENTQSMIPEACRSLGATSKEDCKKLYQDSKECYEKRGFAHHNRLS